VSRKVGKVKALKRYFCGLYLKAARLETTLCGAIV
jgi:hypothetical protein